MAIASVSHKLIEIYGFGVYEGFFKPGDVTPLSDTPPLARRATGSKKTPRIRLDNGTYIWGSQCWWIEERAFRRRNPAKGVKVAPVPSLGAQVDGSHDEVS